MECGWKNSLIIAAHRAAIAATMQPDMMSFNICHLSITNTKVREIEFISLFSDWRVKIPLSQEIPAQVFG